MSETTGGKEAPKPIFNIDDFDVREITRDDIADPADRTEDPLSIRTQLINKEGVHPMKTPDELHKRVARKEKPADGGVLNKVCLGFFPREKDGEPKQKLPAIVTYVYRQKLPADENGHVADKDLRGGIASILNDDITVVTNSEGEIANPNTGMFYTITNLATLPDGTFDKEFPYRYKKPEEGEPSLADVFINKAAEYLRENEGITNFPTLSPMRRGKDTDAKGFAQWLEKALTPPGPGEPAKPAILTREEKEKLQALVDSITETTDHRPDGRDHPNTIILDGLRLAHQRFSKLSTNQKKFFIKLMESLGVYYLVEEKSPKDAKRPLDFVAGVHPKNGAYIAEIQYDPEAETTASDEHGSMGMMVNYRYDPLDELADNKTRYANGEMVMGSEIEEAHTARMDILRAERMQAAATAIDGASLREAGGGRVPDGRAPACCR